MPSEYVAEGVIAAFAAHDLAGKQILLPRAAVARDLIPAQLSKLGARIDVVEAYRNVLPEGAAARARDIFASDHKPDWITFSSSSTVNNFLEVTGVEALNAVKIASIGPVTSSTIRKHGLTITVEARKYTMAGLTEAILATR
jgi:uroporphyrinogen III methyltransferase/synthase